MSLSIWLGNKNPWDVFMYFLKGFFPFGNNDLYFIHIFQNRILLLLFYKLYFNLHTEECDFSLSYFVQCIILVSWYFILNNVKHLKLLSTTALVTMSHRCVLTGVAVLWPEFYVFAFRRKETNKFWNKWNKYFKARYSTKPRNER